MKCPDCKGRGWNVGECHPQEACGICDETGELFKASDVAAAYRRGFEDAREQAAKCAEAVNSEKRKAWQSAKPHSKEAGIYRDQMNGACFVEQRIRAMRPDAEREGGE